MEYRKIDDLCEEGGKLISILGRTSLHELAGKFAVVIDGLLEQANKYYNENQKLIKDNERLIKAKTLSESNNPIDIGIVAENCAKEFMQSTCPQTVDVAYIEGFVSGFNLGIYKK